MLRIIGSILSLILLLDCKTPKDGEKEIAKYEDSPQYDLVKTIIEKGTPIDVSVSLTKIFPTNKFCNKFENGIFGSDIFGALRRPSLDFRVSIYEKDSKISHIASSEGYGLIKTKCGQEHNSRYDLFFNSPIVTRDDQVTIYIKVYENDQVFADNQKEKLNKILGGLVASGNAAIDKGLVQKSKADTILNYLSFVQLPLDLINGIQDFLFLEEDLISSFEFNLYRDNFQLPGIVTHYPTQVFILPKNSLNNFIPIAEYIKNSKIQQTKGVAQIKLDSVAAISFHVTVTVNDLELTFEIQVSSKAEK